MTEVMVLVCLKTEKSAIRIFICILRFKIHHGSDFKQLRPRHISSPWPSLNSVEVSEELLRER